jgi:hypothetical protein
VNQFVGGRRNRSLQSEEHKNLRPDSRRVREGVNTEGLEGSEYNKDSCPAVIERERKMDEKLICEIRGSMGLLDDIVDVLHSSYVVSDGTRQY